MLFYEKCLENINFMQKKLFKKNIVIFRIYSLRNSISPIQEEF